MGAFQEAVRQMRLEELRLLALREADLNARLSQSKVMLAAGIVLGLSIAGMAGWSVQRDNRRRRLAELAVREGQARFRMLAENISQMAWIADVTGRPTWFSRRWFEFTGSTSQDGVDPGARDLIHPEHKQRVIAKLTQAYGSGVGWEDTFPLRARDGTYHWFLTRAVPSLDAEGKNLRWFGTNTDISDRLEMEEALFAEKERAQVTLNSIGDAVACTDIAGNVTFLNRVAETMTGWSCAEPRAADDRGLPHPGRAKARDHPESDGDGHRRGPTVHLPPDCILVAARRDRRSRSRTRSPRSTTAQGMATGAVIVFRDVSAARAMALQMAHSAEHDFLTGLPNRMLLERPVSQAIALAPRHRKKVARAVPRPGRLQAHQRLARPSDRRQAAAVGRQASGRLRPRLATRSAARAATSSSCCFRRSSSRRTPPSRRDRMLQAVAEAHSIDEHDLHVTTSIGVSVYPDDGLDAETLIKNADTAMYQAKENGRQSYQFFKPAMNVRAVERQSIEEGLRARAASATNSRCTTSRRSI